MTSRLREKIAQVISSYLNENFKLNVVGKITCFFAEDKIVLVENVTINSNTESKLSNLYSCSLDELVVQITKDTFFEVP